MSVSVSCEFQRSRGIVFAGEKLKCQFSFALDNRTAATEEFVPEPVSLGILAAQATTLESPDSADMLAIDTAASANSPTQVSSEIESLKSSNGPEDRSEESDDDDDDEGVVVRASAIQQRIGANEEATGFLSWLWPFGASPSKSETSSLQPSPPNAAQLLDIHPKQPVQQRSPSANGKLDELASEVDSMSFKRGPRGLVRRLSVADSLASEASLRSTQLHGIRPFQHISTTSIDSAGQQAPQQQSRGESETLALGFVQLVGYATLDQTIVKPDEALEATRKLLQTGGGGLSLAEVYESLKEAKAFPILVSAPVVLFGSLEMFQGQKMEYVFETVLPSIIPPTHRGRILKVTYKLILGIQKTIYEKPFLVQLPFRVQNFVMEDGYPQEYNMEFPIVLSKEQLNVYSLEDFTIKKPRASSMSRKSRTFDVMDIIKRSESGELGDMFKSKTHILTDNNTGKTMTNIACFLSQTPKVTVDIRKNQQPICRLILRRASFRIGDTIHFSLDFSQANIPSLHVSVFLDQIEVVEPKYLTRKQETIKHLTRRTFAEYHEYCVNTRRLVGFLTIPPGASADFFTSYVSSRWQIRLEFITVLDPKADIYREQRPAVANKPVSVSIPASSGVQLSPSKTNAPQLPLPQNKLDMIASRFTSLVDEVQVESFECNLPVRVMPSDAESCQIYPGRMRFMMVPAD